jgi:hypothetical protein
MRVWLERRSDGWHSISATETAAGGKVVAHDHDSEDGQRVTWVIGRAPAGARYVCLADGSDICRRPTVDGWYVLAIWRPSDEVDGAEPPVLTIEF